MHNRTITALYDSYDQAVEAVRRIEALGVPHSDISIVSNNSDNRHSGVTRRHDDTADDAADGAGTGATLGTVLGGGAGLLAGLGLMAIPGLGPVVAAGWLVSTITGAGIGAATGGLIGSLTGAGMSEADAHAYTEGVRRGGTLVTVRAADHNFQQVVDVLEQHGSVDMDERESSWRNEGWTGRYQAHDHHTTGSTAGSGVAGAIGAAASTARNIGADVFGSDRTDHTSGMGSTGVDATARHASSGFGATDRTGLNERGESIPIVEESLEVGKREVNRGRVRVHSHVVETPVQEQVTLRDEHVHVERRPVDRVLGTGELGSSDNLFRDRTIEVEEHDEEAVVAKQARVKEELVINKEVEQRTQTVSDTVRRTEVEVEDERGNRISGTTGTPTDRNR